MISWELAKKKIESSRDWTVVRRLTERDDEFSYYFLAKHKDDGLDERPDLMCFEKDSGYFGLVYE